jgi:hypothetical protein
MVEALPQRQRRYDANDESHVVSIAIMLDSGKHTSAVRCVIQRVNVGRDWIVINGGGGG